MTQETTTQTEGKKGKRPTHRICAETYIQGKKMTIEVGAAWAHENGNGLNISLNKLVAFEIKPKDQL